MPKCRTIECEIARANRKKNIALAAIAVIGVIVFAGVVVPILLKQGPTPVAGKTVDLKGSIATEAGAAASGTAYVYGLDGIFMGSNALSSGAFDVPGVPSGIQYYLYYDDGGSTNWHRTWVISVPYVAPGSLDTYVGLGGFIVYAIATSYTDQIGDGSVAITRSDSGNAGNTALTGTAGTAKQLTAMITTSTTHSARGYSWMNPVYREAGYVQAFIWIETNATNAYLASGSAGYSIVVSSGMRFYVPISAAIAGANPESSTGQISIIWPASGHYTVNVYLIWDTNKAQLDASKTYAAPLGFTIGSRQITGSVLTVS